MAVLVLAEHDLGTLSAATARIVAAAETLGPVDLLVAGQGVSSVAAEAAKLAGVEKVLVADSAALASLSPEAVAALLARLAEPYTHIVAAAAATGRDAIPRLAAKLDLMPVTDVVAIHGPTRFDRPIYAGNAIETVSSGQNKHLLTIRASAFRPAVTGNDAPIHPVEAGVAAVARFLAAHRTESDLPELSTAQIVVAGGVSFGSAEKFALVSELAKVLGAAVGATRAAVDAGYAPNDWQVGQTGKIIAPDLYIAIGISGALQHLAGIQGAKKIIAINKDPEAPLMKIADIALVGDLFEVVPQLIAGLKR
ncbi:MULTISPECIES: electron transfer flavoprotein subunit alpha/FixB family protein [unclassified Devosia]|jgi:electron transfer flavoprotein alpha subunit|uniref:electron transfer flavoprotein subunit alpha/FixB family protein n=1 Tax=unclassified Devosia TaxID=196773 RepID=UPI00086C30BD|nr:MULTISPECIES: electron transfer flavoprotein subunit alpha/FixB family protein [unclassified Devosia]MBN9360574.1 electron transfer flavoprotein subunit alpha/FixB family protein [Devosia sp.]ODS85455.1 MAG: electron transfer flavoprotein subunit beta [Devosia sp. SCN 66-27]OJX22560.1 MAG: electron transfer flavoprotein subunit alpha [Devosia sp. 66-14]